jgi:hypothetical protein
MGETDMPTHGQIIRAMRPHEESVVVDASGQEILRIRIIGGATRLAIAAADSLQVVKAEDFDGMQPRTHSGSKFDLLTLAEAAALSEDSEPGFLAAVDRGELPPPAKRWRRDERGDWRGDTRWRRGELLAAVANRALRRKSLLGAPVN